MPGRTRRARSVVPAVLGLAVTVCAARTLGPSAAEVERGTRYATVGLREVTTRLAQRSFGGRDNATEGSTLARQYLVRQLAKVGPGIGAASTGAASYEHPFVASGQSGVNLLAVIRGRELPDEYVIVGAHYDGLGRRSDASGRCRSAGDVGRDVCAGATDNATGVAAVLAVGNAIRRLPVKPRRSVVVALWDAEEDGLAGSLAYVEDPVVPLEDTVAYVNLDVQGANLLPSLAGSSFAIAAETDGAPLREQVAAATSAESLATRQLSFIFGQSRSDYANFVAKNVPTVFFSDATGGCYHTVGDTVDVVDFRKLAVQSKTVYRLVVALADADGRPDFVAPSAQLATYDDAVALSATVETGLADVALLSAADQALVRDVAARLQRIVADGPAAFDSADVGVALSAAVDTLAVLGRLGCRPF